MAILFDGTNHPTAAQVRVAGCIGCLMYGGTPQYAKNFTGAQYRDYKANGLLALFAFEVDANDMNGGATAGAAHARALITDLRSKGVDEHEPVCATVDKHVAVANIALAVAYQRGFYDAVKATGWLGPVGAYGFSEFLIAVHNAGCAEWYWGAGARSSMPPYTNIWQDNTGTINVGGSADDRDWILIPLSGGDMNLTDQLPDAKTVAGTGTVQEALTAVLYGISGRRFGGSLADAIAEIQAQLTDLTAAVAALAKPVPTTGSPVSGTYTVSPITLTGPIPPAPSAGGTQ